MASPARSAMPPKAEINSAHRCVSADEVVDSIQSDEFDDDKVDGNDVIQ